MIDINWLSGLRYSVRLSDGTCASPAQYKLLRNRTQDFINASLTNTGNAPLRIKEVVLYSGVFPVPPTCEFYGEGFQMLAQYQGTLNAPRVIGKYGSDEEFFRIPKTKFNADRYTVYNCLMLMPSRHDITLLAFSSCYKYSGEFRFKGSDIEIVIDCEDRLLAPGETWEFDEFALFNGQYISELFALLAERINYNHPPLRYPEMPFGWCSYHCLSGVRDSEMYEQAKALSARIPELKRIQIDDGYQSSSDWLIPNPHSGSTMQEMCARIRELGAEPAGYLAPFIVADDSVLIKEHPDWLVCDEHGNPFHDYTHVDRWYMLDGSNPDAVRYIRHVMRTMHDEWGLRYFKLDFTCYGALPGGVRHNNMTRIEAFRAIFSAIVEEVGSDSYILGCNAPIWAQFGLVHGNRATNDVFRRWETVRELAQQQFWRNWQSLLWINDPDGVVLDKRDMSGYHNGRYRRRISELSDAEFRFHQAYIIACGGVVTSGDLLTEMSDKNLNILRKMMENTGPAAIFDDTSFTIGRAKRSSGQLICVFNWSDEVKCIEVELDGEYSVRELFSENDLGKHSGRIILRDMLPHDARVLVLN